MKGEDLESSGGSGADLASKLPCKFGNNVQITVPTGFYSLPDIVAIVDMGWLADIRSAPNLCAHGFL